MGSTSVLGSMNIVLSGDTESYTKSIDQAQKVLDKFKGGVTSFNSETRRGFDQATAGAQGFSHATVTSVQAASGALRELNGDFTNNIRAVERFITTIPGVGNALKAAFPLVGGLAFGAMIAEQIVKVAAFAKEMREMPRQTQQSFAALSLQQRTATDELVVSTDKMQAFIDKIEHKPINATKMAVDEARLATDRFAASVTNASAKIAELLEKNHIGSIGLLFGKPGTADREGTAKYFARQADDNAYDLANAAPGSPEEAAARAKLKSTQQAQLDEARRDLAKRQSSAKNDDGFKDQDNIGIDKGIITSILEEQRREAAQLTNAATETAKQVAENKKVLAAEGEAAQRKADEQRLHAMEETLNQEKLLGNVTVQAVYQYWEARRSAFRAGSEAYNQVVAKETEAAVESARKAAETIKRFRDEAKRSASEDAGKLPELLNRNAEELHRGAVREGGERDQAMIGSNELAIQEAHNAALEKEARLNEQAGKTITQHAAAVQMLKVHQEEYAAKIAALNAIAGIRRNEMAANPSVENQSKAMSANAAVLSAEREHDLQVMKDNQAIYGEATSGLVGLLDTLDDFVKRTRDAAATMRELTTQAVSGINETILKVLTTPHQTGRQTREAFGNYGAGLFRSVAGAGLNKLEGTAFSALGIGGAPKGTKGDPLHVVMAEVNAAMSGIGRFFKGSGNSGSDSGDDSGDGSGGGFGGFMHSIGGALHLPGFAAGTPDFGGGMAVVGELGPEIVNLPPHSSVTPNNRLGNGGGLGDMHYHIDARGSNDPAAVRQQVMMSIREAAPHIARAIEEARRQQWRRTPSMMRR